MKKTFNRMDEFEIDEISSVDLPAQVPARALLMKAQRDDDLMKRLRLLSDSSGHTHLLDTVEKGGHTSHDMAAKEEFGHSHPWVHNDDGSISVGMADGHTHTVVEKRLTEQDLAVLPGDSLEPAVSGGGPNGETPMTKVDNQTADAEAVEKRLEEAEARAQKAERLAELSDVQKAHMGELSPEAQESFLSDSPEARQAQVEKAQGEDPVVYTTLDGDEIRKSAGSLLLKLAKRADESEKCLAIEKAAREREVFSKRAKDELSNLPGDESTQVALLKAVNEIPSEADRTGALEILKAANEGVSNAFESAGSQDGGAASGDALAKLDELANARVVSTGEKFAKAYKGILETPEGRDLLAQSRS